MIDANNGYSSWARDEWDLPIMTVCSLVPLGQTTATSAKSDTNRAQDFLEATPTAELLPLEAGVQDDESENEMGMTYEGKYYSPYRQNHCCYTSWH